MNKIISSLLLVCFFQLVTPISGARADTVKLPQWYKMLASFEEAPALGKQALVNVELTAVIGDIENASIRLILPNGWTVDKALARVKIIEQDKTEVVKFLVTPKTMLAQGSIVVEVVFNTPKEAIYSAIDEMMLDRNTSENLKKDVKAWPDPTKRYTDIAFAIFPEESFYPLSSDMWVNYDNTLAPDKGFNGPVYYKDSLISIHQAQTDVEMFSRLTKLLETDENLAFQLFEKGIDLNKKHFDYLNGLYVLAVEAWQNNDCQISLDFLEELERSLPNVKGDLAENLKISAANIKALVFWKQNQKRLAQEAFQKAFYQNRKHKLQRYVLRNLGLLMYSTKDKSTAIQMYDLAKNIKKGYSLLDKEYSLLK